MIHGIYKPDTIILRQNIDHRCIYIKWHFILENISKFTFFIFKDNFCSLVRNLDSTTICREWIVLLTAIKNNHIAVSYHIHKNGFHVCHIHLEGTGIYAGDLLFYPPALWKLHFFEVTYKPHSIIFNDNSFRLMKNIHGNQSFSCKILFIFDNFHNCIVCFQCSLIVFFLTLFAENQKSFSVCVKIILLNSKIQKRSLSTFKETCH